MKIIYLTPGCFDKGGISRYNRFQIQALRTICGENQVKVFSLLGLEPDNSFEEDFSVEWSGRFASKTIRKIDFTIAISRAILQWKPNVIWVAHVNLSPLAVKLSKLIRAKTVLNTYGLELWSGLSKSRQAGLKSVDAVIADCFFSARYLEEETEYREKNSVTVIWDAVDITRFFPAQSSLEVIRRYNIPDPSKNLNLLTLGRIMKNSDHKGYNRLLEVFSIVAKKINNLQLIYAGSGDLVNFLQEKTKTMGLSDRVHFAGSIHERDLPDIYRVAHLFSLVSDRGNGRGEGVPVTPLEAAACGVPCIVGNQDGSSEAVVDGITGFIVDPFDFSNHANKILHLANEKELRINMGIANSRRVIAEFSFSKFIEKHNDFLRKTLGT